MLARAIAAGPSRREPARPGNPVRHAPGIAGSRAEAAHAARRGTGGARQAVAGKSGPWRQLRIRVHDAFGPISIWVKDPYQPTPMKPRWFDSSAACA